MKIDTDYVAKHNKKKTIKLINLYKEGINNIFHDLFKLTYIDSQLVCDYSSLFSNERPISFDNFENGSIYKIVPYSNFFLMKTIYDLNLQPGEGLMTYSPIFNRDYKESLSSTPYEYAFLIQLKLLYTYANSNYMQTIVEEIINAVNDLDVTKKDGTKLPKKIKFISVDKLGKQFPLVPKKDLIKVACQNSSCLFVWGVNGNNENKIKYINDKPSIYGQDVGSLFIYHPINNEVIKLLTISTTPSKEFFAQKAKELKLTEQEIESTSMLLSEHQDQISIEFYFDQYLLFSLQKFSMAEILPTPQNIDIITQDKDKIIM